MPHFHHNPTPLTETNANWRLFDSTYWCFKYWGGGGWQNFTRIFPIVRIFRYILGKNSIQLSENLMLCIHVNLMKRYLGSENDYLPLIESYMSHLFTFGLKLYI